MGAPHEPTPGSSGSPESLAAPPAWSVDEPGEQAERALVQAIRRAGTGPEAREQWSRLVNLYQRRLFAVCLRMVGNPQTAQDLTQDVFVKVIQGLNTWDGRSRLSTWMVRVAMNVCLSHLRAAKVRKTTSLDAGWGGTSFAPSLVRSGGASSESVRTIGGNLAEPAGGLSVERDEERRIVASALGELDPDQRAIIVLRDVQGLDYQQIASVLGLEVGTVKSRLFRARLALRNLLEPKLTPRPARPE